MHELGSAALRRANAKAIAARIDAAARLLNNRRIEEAAQLYDEVLAVEPHHPLALTGVGHIAYLKQQIQRGFDLFASAAAIHPNHPIILAGLAQGHSLLGRHEDAAICLERAIEIEPQEARHYCNLGNALMALQRVNEAVAQYKAALALDPQNAISHLSLGLALFGQDWPAAEHHVRRAMDCGSDLPEAGHNLSILLRVKGDLNEAVAHAETAYLADPGNSLFTTTYAGLLADVGRLDEARRVIRRCLALAPHNIDALEVSTRLALLNGDGDSAFRPLAAAVQRAPKDPDVIVALARSFAVAGRLDGAFKLAEEALRLAPAHAEATTIRRRLLLALGRFEDAASELHAHDSASVYVGASTNAGEALLLSRFLLPEGDGREPPSLICERTIGILLAHIDGLAVYESAEFPPDAVPLARHASLQKIERDRVARGLPSLAASPGRAARWADALAQFSAPYVGLTWCVQPDMLTLADLVEAAPAGATLVSLMQDGRRHDLREWPDIVDAGREFETYADLVAAVAAVDFVIACDGVAAHVAGALNKPGIIVLPENLPWCWAHEDGRSIWYPSLTVLTTPIAMKDRGSAIDRLKALAEARVIVADNEPVLAASPCSIAAHR